MTDSEYPLESLLSGARCAVLMVAAYFTATVLGACLGAWSAGWDVYGPEACVMAFFTSWFCLRKLSGLLSLAGIGMATFVYFKLSILKWEALNATLLLWTVYAYVACGAGDAPHSQTVIVSVPKWRIVASIVGLVIVYAAGRTALLLAGPRARRAARAGT